MNILYLDLVGGISGDMAVAALLDLGVPLDLLRGRLAMLGLPQVRLEARREQRHGITGTRFIVSLPEGSAPQSAHATHRPYAEIRRLLHALPDAERAGALAIFQKLAEAEAAIHGVPVDAVEFHEVGAWDSIADVVCWCAGWAHLAPQAVYCSPVPLGRGKVHTAHGVLPIPAPATLRLLQDFPVLLDTDGPVLERTTPTGAAILAACAQPAPASLRTTPGRIGIGVGSADPVEVPNLLRAVWGSGAVTAGSTTAPTAPSPASSTPTGRDWVEVAVCNLDDCSPEWIGYAQERLLELGALDVALVPVQMKKNRPGTQLQVMYPPAQREALLAVLLAETTTLGVRVQSWERVVLPREAHTVQTPWGPLAGKLAHIGGRPRFTPEYEACRDLARRLGLPLQQVYGAAEQAFRAQRAASDADR